MAHIENTPHTMEWNFLAFCSGVFVLFSLFRFGWAALRAYIQSNRRLYTLSQTRAPAWNQFRIEWQNWAKKRWHTSMNCELTIEDEVAERFNIEMKVIYLGFCEASFSWSPTHCYLRLSRLPFDHFRHYKLCMATESSPFSFATSTNHNWLFTQLLHFRFAWNEPVKHNYCLCVHFTALWVVWLCVDFLRLSIRH